LFEKFLEAPKPFFEGGGDGFNNFAQYFQIKLPFVPDPAVVQWHVLAFLSEFTLNTVLVKTLGLMGLPLEGTDYLNWSGQQLYKELKAKAQNQAN